MLLSFFWSFVVSGAILDGLGLYEPLIDFAELGLPFPLPVLAMP